MTTLRIFDPDYIFRSEPVADAVPVGTPTQQVIILETVGSFADREGEQPVFLRLDAEPGALFSGSPDGYGGEIARIRAFEGSLAAAEAGDETALIYDIDEIEGLTLDAYLRNEDPLASDRTLFSGSDTIVTAGARLSLASNVLTLTQDLVQVPDAPPDQILGPNEEDLVEINASSLEVVGSAGEDGSVLLYTRVEPGGTALMQLTEISGIESLAFEPDEAADALFGNPIEVGAFLDRAPLAVDPNLPMPERAGPVAADGSSIDLFDTLLGTALSFRVDPESLDGTPETALGFDEIDQGATLGSIRLDRMAEELIYTATPEVFADRAEGESVIDTVRYSVSDGVQSSALAPVEIEVLGVNDAVLLAPGQSVLTGEILEGGAGTAAGVIAFRDADLSDTHRLTEIAASEEVPGGSFDPGEATATEDPVLRESPWSFEIPAAGLDRLAEGQSATNAYVVEITDIAALVPDSTMRSTDTATVTITFVGENDAPVIDEDATETELGVTEINKNAEIAGDPLLTTDPAILTFDDPDLIDTHSARAIPLGEGFVGDLEVDQPVRIGGPEQNRSEVAWRFSVLDSAVAFLGEGMVLTQAYAIEVTESSIPEAARETDMQVVTVTITGANDAPVCADDTAMVVEDDPAIIIDVLANDIDPDEGDTLTIAALDTDGTLGSVTENLDGTVSYDPNGAFEAWAAGETATDSFTYAATDPFGCECTATVTVTVMGVNDVPEIILEGDGPVSDLMGTVPRELLEGDGLAFDDTGDIVFRDVDLSDTHTVTAVPLGEGFLGSFDVLDPTTTPTTDTGVVTWSFETSAEELSGLGVDTAVQAYLVTITDPSGATAEATVSITLNGFNACPEPAPDAATFAARAEARFVDVLANDTDADGDPLILIPEEIVLDRGLARVEDNGIVFDPAGDFDDLGPDDEVIVEIPYTVTDGVGAPEGADLTDPSLPICREPGLLTVTVTGGNSCPDVVADSVSINSDAAPFLVPVLDNDSDPDGDLLTLTALTGETLGSATIVDNQVRYDPGTAFDDLAPGRTVTEVITYAVTDGECTELGTLSIAVTGVNDCPVVVDDTASVSAVSEPVLISVLDNDSDPDGDTLTIVGITDDIRGSVSLFDGQIRYDPGTAFRDLGGDESATEVVTYAVSDGECTAIGTLTITVTGDNDCPIAADDTATVAADGDTLLIPVLDNDVDLDGDVLEITDISGETVGSFSVFGERIRYDTGGLFDDLLVGQSVTETVTYTVSDGICSDTATLAVTVQGANFCPEPEDDSAALLFFTGQIEIPVLDNDTDANGDALSIVAVEQPSVGSVAIAGDAIVYSVGDIESYVFGQDETATEIFEYTITDGRGCEETAEVRVTISLEGFGVDLVDAVASFDVIDRGLVDDIVSAVPATNTDTINRVNSLDVLDSVAVADLIRAIPNLTINQGGTPDTVLFASAGPEMVTEWEGFSSGGALGASSGFDSVTYDLARAMLSVELTPFGEISVEGPGGESELLSGVERIALQDGALRFDLGVDAPMLHRLYSAAYGRTPDEGGLAYWDGQRGDGMAVLEIADAFVMSTEFEDRFGGAAPEPEAFVDALYLNIFGRAADGTGLDYWTGELAKGLSRGEMLLAFAESAENRALTAADTEDGLWVMA